MSLVFAFLCAANQTKALMLDEAFELHKNLVGKKETGFDKLDKAKKE